MTSIIEELYQGNINPSAVIHSQDSPAEKAADRKRRYLDELMEKMDEGTKEVFNRYCDAQANVDEIIQYDTFAYAMKVGVLLMAEIFMSTDDILGRKGEERNEIHTS